LSAKPPTLRPHAPPDSNNAHSLSQYAVRTNIPTYLIELCSVPSNCLVDSRVTSSISWEQLSALSISGLVVGACVLTCAVCCCCRQRRRRQRRRDVYQQHDLYDDDDADLCACACCPSTSGLYACKYLSVFKSLTAAEIIVPALYWTFFNDTIV